MNTYPLTAAKLEPFTPDSLVPDDDSKLTPVFQIKIPTAVERDQLPALLMDLGLNQVTDSKIRATLIDDLWEHFEPEKAEEMANFLDGVWQRQEVMQLARSQWQEQEVERILDIAEGAPEIEPAPFPESIISPRDQARCELIVDDMCQRSKRIRDLLREKLNYNSNNNMMLVRIHVAAVRNLDGIFSPLEQEDGILTREAAAALREACTDQAWNELLRHIDALYGVSQSEEKNSVSLPERQLDPIGLSKPSDESDISDGSLTNSITEPVRVDESGHATASSFPFTSAPAGQTAPPGLTDAG